MKCGHICEKSCHVYDCNEQKCLKPCSKINPNCIEKKHKCPKKCYEDCGLCEAIVEKKLPCGHIKKDCKCYEKETEIICKEKCNKLLKCGHKCLLYCGQECSSKPCREIIDVELPCGHTNKIECYIKDNIEEAICQEKCNKLLPCGHNCQGTCGLCLQGTLHVKCSVKCGRILSCGHVCSQKCSSECICDQKCPNICEHGFCDLNCCDICVNCREDCTFGCKHSKCQKKCGELCSRKPCDKRCDKKMVCGHRCYGLCGERCPEVCRICNPDLMCFKEDFFYLSEIDEDALIYKTRCGHLFEVSGLDQYFESKSKSIQMFTCPQCKNLLLLEPRYQNHIKSVFADIQKIKKVNLDRNLGKGDNTFLIKSQKIINRIINEQYEKGKINIFDIFSNNNIYANQLKYDKYDLDKKIPIIYNLCKNVFKGEKDINSKKNTTYNLLTLAEKFMGIEYYAYLIKSECEEKKEAIFLRNFNIIKKYFYDLKGQFNNFFFNDLKTKIDNMLYYTILRMKDTEKDIFAFIYNEDNLKTPEEIIKGNFSIKLDLKDLYEKDINIKAIDLLRTLGTTWYKCPNGHLYVVGDCGRPMEESSCPECKKVIGGTNHIPAAQNRAINNIININNNRLAHNLLNQDQDAMNIMNQQHHRNQEHHMDEDIIELINNHPEMNEYN